MNEADTKNMLLHSARRLFALHGYDGTSIRLITSDAGANLGAITYHYGTKEALYDAVLESSVAPMVEAATRADASAPSPLAAIENIVRALIAYFQQDPDVPRLFAHELARDHAAPGPQRRAMQQLVGIVTRRILAGQQDGSIVAGNPILLTFSIVSQPVYWALVRSRLRDALGLQPDAPETGAVEHIVHFIRRGLVPAGRTA